MRVAQEIKNNQDFIYQTNQALQNLRNDILHLSEKYRELFAQVGSNKKSVEIQFDNFCDMCNLSLYNMGRRMSDFESVVSKSSQDSVQKIDSMIMDYAPKEDVNRYVGKLSEWITNVEKATERTNSDFYVYVDQIKAAIKLEAANLRKDLTPVVLAEDPIKQEVDRQLASFKTDFLGLTQEIARLKKVTDYGEKKFENIYTLIERLKARNP